MAVGTEGLQILGRIVAVISINVIYVELTGMISDEPAQVALRSLLASIRAAARLLCQASMAYLLVI